MSDMVDLDFMIVDDAPDKKVRVLVDELRDLLKTNTFAVPESDRFRWADLRERLGAGVESNFDAKNIVRDGYLLLVNADLPRGQTKPFAEWGARAFAWLSVDSWKGMKSETAAKAEQKAAAFTIDEPYEDAKASSLRIRQPMDIRPVRWACNPDKRWVHLTESEWVALCEAFEAVEKKRSALSHATTQVLVSMEAVLKEIGAQVDLDHWKQLLEAGERGEWPPKEAP